MGHMTNAMHLSGKVLFRRQTREVVILYIKFEEHSFIHSKDIEAVTQRSKIGHVTQITTILAVICHVLGEICVLNTKCLAVTVPEIYRGSKI